MVLNALKKSFSCIAIDSRFATDFLLTKRLKIAFYSEEKYTIYVFVAIQSQTDKMQL